MSIGLRPKRIPGLDGLRGAAALTVLLNHMSLNGMKFRPWLDFTGLGKPAVYLFFILSAFLLTSQALHWGESGMRSARNWAGYLVARAFRIWPLFFLYLAASCLTTRFATGALHGKGLPDTMSLHTALRTVLLLEGREVLWTIAVEFKFYLVLPLIVYALVRLWKMNMRGWLGTLSVATVCAISFLPHDTQGVELEAYIAIFLVGVLAAVLHYDVSSRSKGLESYRLPAEAVAWAAILLFACLSPAVISRILGAPVDGEYLRPEHLLLSAIWTTLLLGMLHGTGSLCRLLDSRPLVWLGQISYGLYLWHMTVLQIVVWPRLHLNVAVRTWSGLIGAIAVAAISYYLVESPALRLGSRLRRRLAATPN